MSLTSTDKKVLLAACNKQPNYYIDEDPNSQGIACYNSYKLAQTDAQNQAIGGYCDKLKYIQHENVNFNNCLFNWKQSSSKTDWLAKVCSQSATQLVPPQLQENVYEYSVSSAIPAIFCAHCKTNIENVYSSLTEQQKLLIDVWVSKNINSAFITPSIMDSIQKFKTKRLNEMYSTFKEKQQQGGTYALGSAISETWDSFLNILPYLFIIIICLVGVVFMTRFFGNVRKLSQLGQQPN